MQHRHKPRIQGPMRTMPEHSYLNDFANDTLAIVGAFGFVLTAIGVWLAWLQMRRSLTAAQAASAAAVAALDESRDQYNRFVFMQSMRLLTETRLYIKTESWDAAAIRVADLANLLMQLASTDPSWPAMAGELQSLEKSFERIHRHEISFSASFKKKWQATETLLYAELAKHLAPFQDERSQ